MYILYAYFILSITKVHYDICRYILSIFIFIIIEMLFEQCIYLVLSQLIELLHLF